jgi:hypothetical protein
MNVSTKHIAYMNASNTSPSATKSFVSAVSAPPATAPAADDQPLPEPPAMPQGASGSGLFCVLWRPCTSSQGCITG